MPPWPSALAAARLAWRAAPVTLTVLALVEVATGAAPVLVAWLTKLVIDVLVRGDAAIEELLGLAVALLGAGLGLALLPRVRAFLGQESDRAIALLPGSALVSEVLGAVGARCSWLLVVVFAMSSVGKLRSRAAFVASVRAMRLLPHRAVEPVTVVVGAVEVVTAVLLMLPSTRAIGSALAFLVLAVFTVAIAVVLRRGTVASCRCFGMSESTFATRHVVRNGLLMVAAAAGGAVAVVGPDVSRPVFLLAIGIGAVGGLLVAMLDELVELFA